MPCCGLAAEPPQSTQHLFLPLLLLANARPQEDKDLRIPTSTKMGCTLGPQSRTVEVLEQLLNAGMTVRPKKPNACERFIARSFGQFCNWLVESACSIADCIT